MDGYPDCCYRTFGHYLRLGTHLVKKLAYAGLLLQMLCFMVANDCSYFYCVRKNFVMVLSCAMVAFQRGLISWTVDSTWYCS